MAWNSARLNPGDIISVEWPESRHGIAEVGEWEGRVIAKQGQKITVHFQYEAYEEDRVFKREKDEDIVIDVSRGIDENYEEKVILKRLVPRGSPRS